MVRDGFPYLWTCARMIQMLSRVNSQSDEVEEAWQVKEEL